MSVVIVGGNECMVCKYQETCKKHGCSAKVYVKEKGGLILFTNTVSHKMVTSAVNEAKKNKIPIARSHSSSISALNDVLSRYCAAGTS